MTRAAERRQHAIALRQRLDATRNEQTILFHGRSMAPALADGDCLRVRRVPLAELRPGDIVVFADGEQLIVHRLLALHTRAAGEATLITKGDGAPLADTPVDAGAFVGVVTEVVRDGARRVLAGRRWRAVARLISTVSYAEHRAGRRVRAVPGGGAVRRSLRALLGGLKTGAFHVLVAVAER
jgi:signal peptidase I